VEEELPVDVVPQRRELGLDDLRPCERRRLEVVERHLLLVCSRFRDREKRLPLLLGVLLA